MNYMKTLLIALMFSTVAVGAEAADIAVIDTQKIIAESKTSARAKGYLQKKMDAAQQRINKLESPLAQQQEELKSKKSVLSAEKFEEEEDKFKRAVREYRVEAQSIQEELDRENMTMRREIAQEVLKIAEQVAKDKGLDAVIAKNFLVYSKDSIDITNEVLKKVDESMKDRF